MHSYLWACTQMHYRIQPRYQIMIRLALLFLPVSTGFTPSFRPSATLTLNAPAFVPENLQTHTRPLLPSLSMAPRSLEDEIEYNSRRKAQSGNGELAAGAILGGLVLGPFGALFGAQLGAKFGAKNAVDRARQEEMERLGISQDVLDAAQEIGFALEQSMEGIQASRTSLETQQSFARRLNQNMEETYDNAKRELAAGNEEEARKYLMKKQRLEDKLKTTLKACADEKNRYKQMEQNIASLEERAMEMESLLRRTVGAKTLQSSAMQQLSLSSEDPLLQKFRDIGID